MKRVGRIVSLVGAPVLLAGVLLAGSAGFKSATPATDPLNRLTAVVDFMGTFVLGGSTFTIHSTSCTRHDVGDPADYPCMLAAAGTINNKTGVASSTVAITGADGTITFRQTAVQGCAAGTGFRTGPGPNREPIRVEGVSHVTPISAHILTVTGSIDVYEEGSGVPGIECGPIETAA